MTASPVLRSLPATALALLVALAVAVGTLLLAGPALSGDDRAGATWNKTKQAGATWNKVSTRGATWN